MPADPEDILRLFVLMRFLDHTHDADKHDELRGLHVTFVLLATKHTRVTHTTQPHKHKYRSHKQRQSVSNESSLHGSIGKSQ